LVLVTFRDGLTVHGQSPIRESNLRPLDSNISRTSCHYATSATTATATVVCTEVRETLEADMQTLNQYKESYDSIKEVAELDNVDEIIARSRDDLLYRTLP